MQVETESDLRLVAFNTCEENRQFVVQMYGLTLTGRTIALRVTGYLPFFYVKVDNEWNQETVDDFVEELGGAYVISSGELMTSKKLYGFDAGALHPFVCLKFVNETAMRNVKKLWYDCTDSSGDRKLNAEGYFFGDSATFLYEAQIPPLLRLFHIKSISPSGWIRLPSHILQRPSRKKLTLCDAEFNISYEQIVPLPNMADRVPYKICSFDIEASSSHGDFPLPVKTYKKLAENIADITVRLKANQSMSEMLIRQVIHTAFHKGQGHYGLAKDSLLYSLVDEVFPIIPISEENIILLLDEWMGCRPVVCKFQMEGYEREAMAKEMEAMYTAYEDEEEDDNGGGEDDDDHRAGGEGEVEDYNSSRSSFAFSFNHSRHKRVEPFKKNGTVYDLLLDPDVSRETLLVELNKTLCQYFPQLKGDTVTFIGSTFMRYGEEAPYLNHCIVGDTCGDVDGAEIQCCASERDVLLAWTALIKRENPDIVIGYNIFGFDYQFMYLRAKELKCEKEFMMLSRNVGELALKHNWKTNKLGLEESSIVLAGGQHDLRYARMTGRLQIDLYNYFRRDYQLSSYKLDYVSGYFIGDAVKKLDFVSLMDDGDGEVQEASNTWITTQNLTGLVRGNFICIEEEAHTMEEYKNGAKFQVLDIDRVNKRFLVGGVQTPDLVKKKVRWCLAKDDVTPQDIFRMTNEGPTERAVIAKYCIQDCNLVHHLLRKIDVLTSFIEMSNLCSVPMEYLVLRGQGIKLTSYVAKKCREMNTLMPVINKGDINDGYEGATVLEPKCKLYLDTPVACLDYSSLYPSNMISENISHDSKVWTKEFDLTDVLVKEEGEKDDKTGAYKYDNLPGYSYVDITYDNFKWQPKKSGRGMEKILTGKKICRFAQFPVDPVTGEQKRGILPAILQELLVARKTTRKLILKEDDEFMKNVLDKRQLSIKVTANSMYGQTGAKTSTFYEKDCAASTTAMGRTLLLYGKQVIEDGYGNQKCATKNHGDVMTHAEYVYGDTDSVFFKFNLTELDGITPIVGPKALEITIELAKQAGELASQQLKHPHDLEYEKTFMPFLLLSKKRYVGMMYEDDHLKCKRKSMGIVLKRRDNAPIVKDIYGGIIDLLMKGRNVDEAVVFLRSCLEDMVNEKCSVDKLIISKALRSGYKNPKQIAHKVLADRMGERDVGNKPSIGDRIPFIYIVTDDKKALQGDRIETPDYIKQHQLKIDYPFYITNQIMKPVQQVFALLFEEMNLFKSRKNHSLSIWHNELAQLRLQYPQDNVTYKKKEEALRAKEVKIILFDIHLQRNENVKHGLVPITNFFSTNNTKPVVKRKKATADSNVTDANVTDANVPHGNVTVLDASNNVTLKIFGKPMLKPATLITSNSFPQPPWKDISLGSRKRKPRKQPATKEKKKTTPTVKQPKKEKKVSVTNAIVDNPIVDNPIVNNVAKTRAPRKKMEIEIEKPKRIRKVKITSSNEVDVISNELGNDLVVNLNVV